MSQVIPHVVRPWRLTAKRRKLLRWLRQQKEGEILVSDGQLHLALGADWWQQLHQAQKVSVEGWSAPGEWFNAVIIPDLKTKGFRKLLIGPLRHDLLDMALRGNAYTKIWAPLDPGPFRPTSRTASQSGKPQ